MSYLHPARLVRRSLGAVILMTGVACGGSSLTLPNPGGDDRNPEPPAPSAARVEAVAGVAQSAAVGTEVGTAPAVRVTDASGQPVAGCPVTFVVTGGGAEL
jgi:hypothetical protein